MSEQSVIQLTQNMNTVDTIHNNLLNLGVKTCDILLVHSSLSSIGWVCAAAQAVIISLRKVLNENGTLIMPAHSGAISDPAAWENPPIPKEWLQPIYDSMPAFDVNLTQKTVVTK